MEKLLVACQKDDPKILYTFLNEFKLDDVFTHIVKYESRKCLKWMFYHTHQTFIIQSTYGLSIPFVIDYIQCYIAYSTPLDIKSIKDVTSKEFEEVYKFVLGFSQEHLSILVKYSNSTVYLYILIYLKKVNEVKTLLTKDPKLFELVVKEILMDTETEYLSFFFKVDEYKMFYFILNERMLEFLKYALENDYIVNKKLIVKTIIEHYPTIIKFLYENELVIPNPLHLKWSLIKNNYTSSEVILTYLNVGKKSEYIYAFINNSIKIDMFERISQLLNIQVFEWTVLLECVLVKNFKLFEYIVTNKVVIDKYHYLIFKYLDNHYNSEIFDGVFEDNIQFWSSYLIFGDPHLFKITSLCNNLRSGYYRDLLTLPIAMDIINLINDFI